MDDDRTAVAAMLAADPRLAELTVNCDRRGDRPAGQDGDLLTLAVTNCDGEMLAALLRAGVSPQGVERGRALNWALLADEPDMAELLLRAGASPDPQKLGGLELFSDVTAARQLGGVMMLVRHGLDLGWTDEFGSGHLKTAVDMESFAIAEELVRAGAPLWRVSMGGFMPSHSLFRPRILSKPAEDAAAERLRAGVRRPGLPWPPPSPDEALIKVLAAEWPTAAMREAGMAAMPVTLAMLRQRARDYGQDGTAKP